MSEVKRYGICGFEGGVIELKDGHLVHVDDFDRVTAERDAALASLDSADSSAQTLHEVTTRLQQRLTAADERADVLEGLLRRAAAFTHDLQNPISLRRDIYAALKPAEAARCARCDCSTVETCDERGCGYLGAGNGAPE